MVKNRLVSVIIPIYQNERYLNKCLITVTQQTYSNLEIILVDDGSKDSSPIICDKWAKKDSRIKVIHKENGGTSDSRNVGLSIATGDYVAFVDSDDWIAVTMIQKLVTSLENANADMAVCQFVNVFSDGRIQRNTPLGKSPQAFDRCDFLSCLLENKAITNHVWCKLYKRCLIPNDIFPKGKTFEDIYAMPKLIKKCKKIVCMDDLEYFYRFGDNRIINNKQMEAYLDAIIYQYNYFKHLEPKLTRKINKMMILKRLGIGCELILSKSIKPKIRLNSLKTILNSIFTRVDNHVRNLKLSKALKQQLKIKAPKFIILGYPDYGNLGDRALGVCEEQFIKTYFPEYKVVKIKMAELHLVKKLRKFIQSDDIIGLQAGGNIGSLYPGIHELQEDALANFPNRRVFIFPQTFFFSRDTKGKQLLVKTEEVYKTMNHFFIFVRDKFSYDFVSQNIPSVNVDLKPDMALMLGNNDSYPKHEMRSGVLILLRNDNEKTLSDNNLEKVLDFLNRKFNHHLVQSDTHVYHDDLDEMSAKRDLQILWDTMSAKELVVTDRLHGMVFAAITGTPCIVLQSKSPKVKGVYNWIKRWKYIELVEDITKFDNAVEKVLKVKNCEVEMQKINDEFAEMAKEIKEL